MIESNISIEYRGRKEVDELRKKSDSIGRNVDKIAAELDLLREKASALQEEIRQCDAAEMTIISDFDRWIVYYNEVAASRMKELQKKVKELRKRRIEALEELAKTRPKISVLKTSCEMLSYKQGELLWENMIQRVKGRKWKRG